MDSAKRLQTSLESVTRFFGRKPQALARPRLFNPVRYPFGEFEFHIEAPSGQEVELQFTRDFKTWDTLEKVTAGRKSTVYSDQKAGNHNGLFYRAVSTELYSNVIGFISFEVPPGYSMVTNPLLGASGTVEALFPAVPDETAVNKFNLVTFSLDKNKFHHKKWDHPGQTLVPGEGALIFNPSSSPWTARFVGEVTAEEESIHIHAGTSMRGSVLPLSGRLDTDLSFPIQPGDVVSLYSNAQEQYVEFKYTDTGWAGNPPILRLGEAFWVAKNTSAVWKQKIGTAGAANNAGSENVAA